MTVAESFGLTADKINELIDTHGPEWVSEAPDLELVPATEKLCDWLRRRHPRTPTGCCVGWPDGARRRRRVPGRRTGAGVGDDAVGHGAGPPVADAE